MMVPMFPGEYCYLNDDIPPLWLAYLGDPSDSGISCITITAIHIHQ